MEKDLGRKTEGTGAYRHMKKLDRMRTMFEKARLRTAFLWTTNIKIWAIKLTQIWISMAFWLSPKKYLSGKFCFMIILIKSYGKIAVLKLTNIIYVKLLCEVASHEVN